MKKKKSAIFIFIFLGILLSLIIYHNFFRIDFSEYSETLSNGTYDSPDGKYNIYTYFVIPRNSNDHYFVMGKLVKVKYISENHQIISDSNTKIVYWDKKEGEIPRESIASPWVDIEKFHPKDISAAWIDNKNFQIEDKKLNVHYGRYDYRRDFN
ncbi:MAG: DUF5412 family protein [Muricomes sp.]